MSDLVLCEKRDGVALLALNRPRQLNVLSYALIDRMMSLLNAIEYDSHTKALVLTGAGDKAFSAGADIKEFSQTIKQGPDFALKLFVKRGQAMTARLEAFPKPVIAALLNGLAFGAGLRDSRGGTTGYRQRKRLSRQASRQRLAARSAAP